MAPHLKRSSAVAKFVLNVVSETKLSTTLRAPFKNPCTIDNNYTAALCSGSLGAKNLSLGHK